MSNNVAHDGNPRPGRCLDDLDSGFAIDLDVDLDLDYDGIGMPPAEVTCDCPVVAGFAY
jgi:hypothetical protein